MWADEDLKDKGYPRWQIVQLCRELNTCRRENVYIGNIRVAAKSMSSLRTQTTNTGTISHLSFVIRKYEDLGTELKAAAYPGLCMIEYLDIVIGRKDIHCREFGDEANKRVTTACCIRVADGYC